MNQTQLAALVAFLVGATGSAMTTSALLRETPGTKAYYAHQLCIGQSPIGNPDGGNVISATAFVDVTLGLTDGGTSVVDLGGVPWPLTAAQETQAQNILTAAANAAKNAP